MIAQPDWESLAERCQKPNYRTAGNWYARRIVRPTALRVTWLVLPSGVSAHTVTLAAWFVGLAAAAAMGVGGWLAAGLLAQAWYFLDHVDGQVARFRGAATLDGVSLDYLMHHTISVAWPIAAGCGLSDHGARPIWLLIGCVWAIGWLAVGLANDVRYKAFFQRLKRVEGELRLVGGVGRPAMTARSARRGILAAATWLARKIIEPHMVIQWLVVAGIVGIVVGDDTAARVVVAVLASAASLVAAATVWRGIAAGQAEREFAAWFQPPAGRLLTYDRGVWRIEPEAADASSAASGTTRPAEPS